MNPQREFKTASAEDRLRLSAAFLAQYYSLVHDKPMSVEDFMGSPLWTQPLGDGPDAPTYEKVSRELANELARYEGMSGFIDLWQAMFRYWFGGIVKNLQGKNSQAIQDDTFEFGLRANLLIAWANANRMLWRYDFYARRGVLGLRWMPEHRVVELFFGKEVMSVPVDFIVKEVWLDLREGIGLHLPNAVHGYLMAAATMKPMPSRATSASPQPASPPAPSAAALVATALPDALPTPAPSPAPTAPPAPTAEERQIAAYFGEEEGGDEAAAPAAS